jgi:hypothetical protein
MTIGCGWVLERALSWDKPFTVAALMKAVRSLDALQRAGQSRLHQQACLLLWVTLRKHWWKRSSSRIFRWPHRSPAISVS